MKIIRFFILALLVLISVRTYSQEKDPIITIEISEPGNKDSGKRPKLPSRQFITCSYLDGEMIFQFLVDEGICDVTVTNLTTGMPQFFEIDSAEDSYIYVGDLETASVVIRTETGHTYSGEF